MEEYVLNMDRQDTSYTLQVDQLIREKITSHSSEPAPASTPISHLSRLHHFATPSLPFLVALLCQPLSDFPPPNCTLFVIDALSGLFSAAFPRSGDASEGPKDKKQEDEARQWASRRRWAILEDTLLRLHKVSAIHNIAVLLLNQTTTRLDQGSGVLLQSALTGKAYEHYVKTRIVTFQDWPAQTESTSSARENDHTHAINRHCAIVVKTLGQICYGPREVITFQIGKVRR